jgi:hypothetical protein
MHRPWMYCCVACITLYMLPACVRASQACRGQLVIIEHQALSASSLSPPPFSPPPAPGGWLVVHFYRLVPTERTGDPPNYAPLFPLKRSCHMGQERNAIPNLAADSSTTAASLPFPSPPPIIHVLGLVVFQKAFIAVSLWSTLSWNRFRTVFPGPPGY